MSIRTCNSDMVARGRAAFVAALIVLSAALCLASNANASGVIWIHVCGSWTPGANAGGGDDRRRAFRVLNVAESARRISAPRAALPAGCGCSAIRTGVTAGSRAYWEIDAPSGFAVISAHTEGSGMLRTESTRALAGAAVSTGRVAAHKVTTGRVVVGDPVHQLAVFRLANHLWRKHLQRVEPPRRGRGPWAGTGGH